MKAFYEAILYNFTPTHRARKHLRIRDYNSVVKDKLLCSQLTLI